MQADTFSPANFMMPDWLFRIAEPVRIIEGSTRSFNCRPRRQRAPCAVPLRSTSLISASISRRHRRTSGWPLLSPPLAGHSALCCSTQLRRGAGQRWRGWANHAHRSCVHYAVWERSDKLGRRTGRREARRAASPPGRAIVFERDAKAPTDIAVPPDLAERVAIPGADRRC